MTKKITSLLLALLMVLPLAACAEDKTSADTTAADTTAAVADTAETTEPVETEDPNTVDNLPADLNFGDETFTIYTRNFDSIHPNLDVQESNGEQLNDALYQRGRDVEARLGIVLDEMMSISTDTAPIKTAIQAGDTTYKLATVRCVYTVEYASSDLGYDWSQVDHIDLSKDYWYDSINKNLTIAGKTFTAAGAYNLSSFDFTHILMFNKKLISDLNLESPFDIVKNKQWTWDKLIEMGTAATSDMNGDGKMELGPDRFGLFCISKQLTPSFWISAGQETITKDENDMPVLNLDDRKLVEQISKLREYAVSYEQEIYNPRADSNTGGDGERAVFRLFLNDQALFYVHGLGAVQQFRDMKSDFGVLPTPKLDETQKDYFIEPDMTKCFAIPAVASDLERTAIILEAMAYEGYTYLRPRYYESMLQSKYLRDEESIEMMDEYIYTNIGFTPGVGGKTLAKTLTAVKNGDGDIASTLATSKSSIEEEMKKYIALFE